METRIYRNTSTNANVGRGFDPAGITRNQKRFAADRVSIVCDDFEYDGYACEHASARYAKRMGISPSYARYNVQAAWKNTMKYVIEELKAKEYPFVVLNEKDNSIYMCQTWMDQGFQVYLSSVFNAETDSFHPYENNVEVVLHKNGEVEIGKNVVVNAAKNIRTNHRAKQIAMLAQ